MDCLLSVFLFFSFFYFFVLILFCLSLMTSSLPQLLKEHKTSVVIFVYTMHAQFAFPLNGFLATFLLSIIIPTLKTSIVTSVP